MLAHVSEEVRVRYLGCLSMLLISLLVAVTSTSWATNYDMGRLLREAHPFSPREKPEPKLRHEPQKPAYKSVQHKPHDRDTKPKAPYEAQPRTSSQSNSPVVSSYKKRNNWYVSANIGLHVPNDHDWKETVGGSQDSGDVWAEESIGLVAAVGYKMGWLRVESEFSYRYHDLKHANVNSSNNSGGLFSSTGQKDLAADVETFAFMTNLWFEGKIGSKWRPFIGGGVGFATHYVDVRKVAGVTQDFYAGDQVFAYQYGLGIGYQILPHAMISVSYRFFETDDAILEDNGIKYEANYYSNNLMAGLILYW